jgi:hypothetical protein
MHALLDVPHKKLPLLQTGVQALLEGLGHLALRTPHSASASGSMTDKSAQAQ